MSLPVSPAVPDRNGDTASPSGICGLVGLLTNLRVCSSLYQHLDACTDLPKYPGFSVKRPDRYAIHHRRPHR